MSLDDNKRLVWRYLEIYNRNDLDALSEVLADDLLTPLIMEGLPSGLEGAKAAHRIMLKAFPDFTTTIEDLMAEGDMVAARIRMRGMYIVRIENGKIAEHWGEEDSISLLTQLGGRPQVG